MFAPLSFVNNVVITHFFTTNGRPEAKHVIHLILTRYKFPSYGQDTLVVMQTIDHRLCCSAKAFQNVKQAKVTKAPVFVKLAGTIPTIAKLVHTITTAATTVHGDRDVAKLVATLTNNLECLNRVVPRLSPTLVIQVMNVEAGLCVSAVAASPISRLEHFQPATLPLWVLQFPLVGVHFLERTLRIRRRGTEEVAETTDTIRAVVGFRFVPHLLMRAAHVLENVFLCGLVQVWAETDIISAHMTPSVFESASGTLDNLIVASPIEALTDDPRRLIVREIAIDSPLVINASNPLTSTWSLPSDALQWNRLTGIESQPMRNKVSETREG